MYLVDPVKVPGLSVVPLSAAHGSSLVFGWWLGGKLIARGRQRAAAYGAAVAALLVALAAVLMSGRLGRYGSFDEWTAGRSRDLMEVKLGYVLVAVLLGHAIAALYTAIELVRDSRRVRAR